MSGRELMAYALSAVMLIAAAGAIAWLRYNSRERRMQRQRGRDEGRYRERLAQRESGAVSADEPARS